ncbi:Clp protease N-terminal domain-containing protein [Actinomycetospora cinnamomea]|uniref:ClpA/ClpB-like protein n=1 Tax=Actinomycetospora cinnamomea TaxID=663609 RepID=A0A2U1EW27_9PSEU|nr:Clp protease N-terminal domain-containing protein [Actinomycetospora cinnamomea]PVZ03920.1 ClpA/ClpB-like protein [Actinomycetospora cinnamomea]
MGTTTPIHDALAEALRELQHDLDLACEVPVGETADTPADPADADPADHVDADPAGHADADDTDDAPEHDTHDENDGHDGHDAHDTHDAHDGHDTHDENDTPDAPAEPDISNAPDTPAPDDAAPTVAADAEEVVALAWCEADERGHGCFGTGHLLLGLVRADGPEAGLLAAAGVTPGTADAAMVLVASNSVSEPVVPGAGYDPVADASVAEVLDAAATTGHVTAAGLLAALLARPWGQAAEMLAALGVASSDLARAADAIAEKPSAPPRPLPRDPSGLLSTAWRAPVDA